LDKPISEWNYLLKEIEDRVISLMLLILVSPLMAVIRAAIKIDSPGPVLFRQNRYGFNNNLFSVFKFRTMIHDRPPDVGSAQATKEDLRVTRIGKFLRASSLDELPQLLNVFFGTMSLVGPRPLPIALVEENVPLIKGYHGRHRIKPGITAWAQVNGLRGETAVPGKMKKRVDHDIYYMENWSIIFDLKILVMTIGVVLNQKDAY